MGTTTNPKDRSVSQSTVVKPFARSYAIKRKPGIHYPHAGATDYQPGQLPAAYVWPTSVSVTPQTIVIGELGGKFYPNDVQTWASKGGFPTPTISTYLLPGASDSAGEADGEVALDWQRAAEAYSYITNEPANIVIVYGPNTGTAFTDVTNYCNTLPNVGAGSWSWGSEEDDWASSDLASLITAITASTYPWLAASGDNDSNDGSNSPVVDCPACLPNILGCGGTSRPPSGGVETVWNNGDGEGTGGGFSKIYSRLVWQPVNSQGTGRMVPDWAAVADPQTGYNTLINGQWEIIAGTSAVAPLLAGFLAAVNGSRIKNGLAKVSQFGPLLWAAVSSFLDITSGNNGTYSATQGPDPCSGLGRPLGTLFSALTGSQVPPPINPTPVNPNPPVSNPTLFTLTFPRAEPIGSKVTFKLPIAVTAGEVLNVSESSQGSNSPATVTVD